MPVQRRLAELDENGVLKESQIPQAALSETFAQRPSWIQAVRTEGNFSISGSGGSAWSDFDQGGTAAARPLDVVLPGMEVGDHFDFRPVSVNLGDGAYFLGNCAIIKDGAVVRYIASSLYGFAPWQKVNSTSGEIWSVPSPRSTVQPGDLEDDGTLRLRFRYTLTTGSRVVNASPDVPLIFEGRGPLG